MRQEVLELRDSDRLEQADRDVVAAAKSLAVLSPGRSLREIGTTWLQILLILAVALYAQSVWLSLAAAVLIGARQYALLILLHDGTHGLFHPSRCRNDMLTLWLVAAPCGSSFVNSRATHLLHHRFLGDVSRDPDYFLYCSGSPAPKQQPAQLLVHFLKLIFGAQVVHTLFGGTTVLARGDPRAALWPKVRGLAPVAVVQGFMFAAFWSAGHPLSYLALWVLPLLTLAVLFNGARVFCEHANSDLGPGASQALLVTFKSNPIERFFFAPFHMNYHAEHHFFPYVPHYNLPKLRSVLWDSPSYRDRILARDSYLRFICEFVSGTRRAFAQSSPPA
jgi:fatty acid desaturase